MTPIAPTGWVDALGARGGPLASAARRFLTEHPGAPASPLARGSEGLRRLAEAIDAWAEQDDSDATDDEGFIEGAGALLGCVLLDHFPSSAHAAREGAHRVRLGAFGYFDPFRAVESALEGPSARAVLAGEVARAEDEEAGRAGAGRALCILEARLAALRPELAIERHFEHDVVLTNGVELDLSRILVATHGEDEAAVARAIEKLLSMLPGGARSEPCWDELRRALLPRLVSSELLLELGSRVELAVHPILGGVLRAALITASEGRARYVAAGELSRSGVEPEAALAIAIENLAARSATARFARVDTSAGPWIVARTGDALDGARLLLPTLHEVLAPELGSPFLAAAPHRDALFACAIEPPALRAALTRRIRDEAARAPHRVSHELFVVGPGGLRGVFHE